MTPQECFDASDAAATVELYRQLCARGPVGHVAQCLFRAQKTSSRAKVYRGRRFTSAAYENKASSMEQCVKMLEKHGSALGFGFGWKEDPSVLFGDAPSWVLYVDIPAGLGAATVRQVSFHSPQRGNGPTYSGEWDKIKEQSAPRIIAFCTYVLTLPAIEGESEKMPFGKHRGEDLAEIPIEYLKWVEREMTLTARLRDAINHEISRREGDRPGAGRVMREAGG
jgi:hypothetical protein